MKRLTFVLALLSLSQWLIFGRAKPRDSGTVHQFSLEEAMKFTRIAILLSVLVSSLLAAHNAHAELIPFPDGMTVYDTVLKVRWLANANLPGTPEGRFGVSNITPNGSMDYLTALEWLAALNGLNGGAGYLRHNDWTLPTSPTFPATDPSCAATGPNGNSFGFGCMESDMGSLFYVSLGLQYPDTAVPIPNNSVGPFNNFQPYLYWTNTSAGGTGYHTFSFNTGWAGANVDGHYMYVLPMIKGNPFGIPVNGNGLQPSADGQTVYDPDAVYDAITNAKGVTWLANADLAKTEEFGAQCIHPDGVLCINPDGSMTHTTALNWIDGMNAVAYLGQTHWQLPPDPNECGDDFDCTVTPLGNLYYNQLHLSQGTPVVPTPDINVGPFRHLQPYLYWSCSAPQPPASPTTCDNNNPPAPGYEWSFSFGNGFEGTDVLKNDLYVMVYFPETPAQALAEAITEALGNNPEYNAFESQAANIFSAPNAQGKAGRLQAFINHVNAQRGKALTAAQAYELIALAQAI